MFIRSRSVWFAVTLYGGAALASSCAHVEAPKRTVRLEEYHVMARAAYDAQCLLERGNALAEADRYGEAVAPYMQLIEEFPSSRLVPVAHFNAGLCLEALMRFEEAASHHRKVVFAYPQSHLYQQASFHFVDTALRSQQWAEAEAGASRLMQQTSLTVEQRIQLGAGLAQALMAQHKLLEAETQARQTVQLFKAEVIKKPDLPKYYAAGANFYLAEAIRKQSFTLVLNDTILQAQQQKLGKRAEVLLKAQHEYYNTLLYTDKHWTALSGYRIGSMYDALWHAMMNAPVPENVSAEGHAIYRSELARMVKPLIRHAIRYWELTQLILINNRIEAEWAPQLALNIERMRGLLKVQPQGPEGIPVKSPAPTNASIPSSSHSSFAPVIQSENDQPKHDRHDQRDASVLKQSAKNQT